jgi:hypothetical protein
MDERTDGRAGTPPLYKLRSVRQAAHTHKAANSHAFNIGKGSVIDPLTRPAAEGLDLLVNLQGALWYLLV